MSGFHHYLLKVYDVVVKEDAYKVSLDGNEKLPDEIIGTILEQIPPQIEQIPHIVFFIQCYFCPDLNVRNGYHTM